MEDGGDEQQLLRRITSQEETQLRRVYGLLCDLHAKAILQTEIDSREAEIATLSEQKEELFRTEALGRLREEVAAFENQIRAFQENPHKKIQPADVAEALRMLGKKCSKNELQDMIWEVDENLDGCVDWDEFCLMFLRNISDVSGLEPSKFYNLVQFMIFDQNENGRVSVDETMNMLYERYGRGKMEGKLRELFGSNMQETGTQGGEIGFKQYLKAVERIQMKTFEASSLGKLARKKGS